jgi:pyruvate/2-oxoglutarate dehydrogenase complex dihydrolipoamide acyltransferase (E2) component
LDSGSEEIGRRPRAGKTRKSRGNSAHAAGGEAALGLWHVAGFTPPPAVMLRRHVGVSVHAVPLANVGAAILLVSLCKNGVSTMLVKKKYRIERLSFLRKAVIASASITRQKNTIHLFSEVDVTLPLQLISEKRKDDGTKLSFTTFLAKSFANVIERHPELNSFISGNKQIFIEDINISILIERQIGNVSVPEPMVLRNIAAKKIMELSDEIRAMQQKAKESGSLGSLSNAKYINLIPGFLLKTFVRIADRSIKMGISYGKLAITSIGMFSTKPIWIIPHGSATILLSVGSFIEKKVDNNNMKVLNLTVSFDHDIIDGAPAARFMNELIDEISGANCLMDK